MSRLILIKEKEETTKGQETVDNINKVIADAKSSQKAVEDAVDASDAPLHTKSMGIASTANENTRPKTGDTATALPLFGSILSALGFAFTNKRKRLKGREE